MIPALIGLLIALLFGGGDTEYYLVTALDKGVKTCVVDKENQKAIKAKLKEGEKITDAYYKVRKKNIKKLKSLIANQATSQEEFDAFVAKQFAALKEHQETVFKTRMECLEDISEDEWACILETADKERAKMIKKRDKKGYVDIFSKVETTISKVIVDTDKKEKALASFSELQKNYKNLYDALSKRNETENPTIRDYNSSIEDLRMVSGGIDQYRTEAYGDLVKFHQSMKELATPEEWKKISKQLINSVNKI